MQLSYVKIYPVKPVLCLFNRDATVLLYSFVSQRLNRIRQRCADGLETHGQQGDEQREGPGNYKQPPTDINPVSEFLQPFIDGIPGEGPGDKIGQQNRFGKIFGKQS